MRTQTGATSRFMGTRSSVNAALRRARPALPMRPRSTSGDKSRQEAALDGADGRYGGYAYCPVVRFLEARSLNTPPRMRIDFYER
ncbi:hypothetical protein EVAR_57129_1 [Eumeta japonica]|uniref:Uncharacterized protein n=1 Tax=Eumeta variegata TaxID=151549 RepID=A0A4C1YTH9_EUMVA|nr:hypothetical protein EVAR_57129_1 [Eumeta japonica]